jgi:hypothetical protein
LGRWWSARVVFSLFVVCFHLALLFGPPGVTLQRLHSWTRLPDLLGFSLSGGLLPRSYGGSAWMVSYKVLYYRLVQPCALLPMLRVITFPHYRCGFGAYLPPGWWVVWKLWSIILRFVPLQQSVGP